MKIEVGKIKDREIQIEEDIPASSWEMDSFDVKFVDNIHLDCKFKKIGKEIIVNIEASTARLITCSRCLEQTKRIAKQNFSLNYNISNLGNYLDIDKDVREEILLSFPMKVLCRQDCKGICSGCGANLNHQKCSCKKNSKSKIQNAK